MLKRFWPVIFLTPAAAGAGTSYDVTIRSLNESDLAGVTAPRENDSSGPPQSVTPYFVDNGRVRVGAPTAKTVYIFKDRLLYRIDAPSRSVDVLKHATLSEVSAHYADVLKQLEDAAAQAPAPQRAEALRKAEDMKTAAERLRQPAPVYTLTVRTESVGGHICRIWEEKERDVKRLEFCVVPTAALPGGAEILAGLKTLGQFRQGSNFAFGVEFGVNPWWPDVAGLGGVPVLIREFKYESEISQTTLTSIQTGVAAGTLLEMPEGFRVQDAPAYAQWNVR